MTIMMPAHRALSSTFAGRSFKIATRYGYNPWLARVNQRDESSSSQTSTLSHCTGYGLTRKYATTTAKTSVGRPKAHTGRTPASKPGPKTAEGKSRVGRKPAAKAKSKAKPKSKPKKTPKKKVVAKKTVKKPKAPLSPKAIDRAARHKALVETRALQAKALLDSPKNLPRSAWAVLFSEAQQAKDKAGPPAQVIRDAAARYKQLSAEEHAHYNHIASQNLEKNEIAYKKWVQQHTPEQIREANNARRQLKARWAAKHNKTKNVQKFPAIEDERLVKRPLTSFFQYTAERRQSADFYKMEVAEVSKLLAREYKALDPATRKKYEDKAAADLNRYTEEVKTVYGQEVVGSRKKKAA